MLTKAGRLHVAGIEDIGTAGMGCALALGNKSLGRLFIADVAKRLSLTLVAVRTSAN